MFPWTFWTGPNVLQTLTWTQLQHPQSWLHQRCGKWKARMKNLKSRAVQASCSPWDPLFKTWIDMWYTNQQNLSWNNFISLGLSNCQWPHSLLPSSSSDCNFHSWQSVLRPQHPKASMRGIGSLKMMMSNFKTCVAKAPPGWEEIDDDSNLYKYIPTGCRYNYTRWALLGIHVMIAWHKVPWSTEARRQRKGLWDF